MKERTIIFPFNDSEENLRRKISIVKDIVGKENVSYIETDTCFPELTVRCDKKNWKLLKFKLDLTKVYY